MLSKKNIRTIIIYSATFCLLNCNYPLAWSYPLNIDLCNIYGQESGLELEPWDDGSDLFHPLGMADENMPNYLIFDLATIISRIAVTDASILKDPNCDISKYIELLLIYYSKHTKKVQKHHPYLAELIEFIDYKIRDKANEEK
ncbi:MAG: hypothetical protein KKE11_01495 [Gammaproteobacteria bacterium]|nr:hypothetical protein [Gammaproteobacteria bacterium]